MQASSIDEIEREWDLQSSLVELNLDSSPTNGCNSSSESAIYSPAKLLCTEILIRLLARGYDAITRVYNV